MPSSLSGKGYNHLSADAFRKTFNAQTTTNQDALKQLLKDQYTPDTIGGTIFFAATVLSIEETVDPSETPHGLSFFGFGDKKIKRYRVIIPEVHAGIPAPDIFPEIVDIKTEEEKTQQQYAQSLQKLKSFPIVSEFRPGDQATENIKIGDPVWVIFQNSRTLENGFLFAKIIATGGIGANTITFTDVKKGSGFQDSPLSPAGLTQSEKEAAKDVMPVGFNKKWLIDYSAIIDVMASSKGAPYRYGWFPDVYHGERWESERQKYGFQSISKEELAEIYKIRPNINAGIFPDTAWSAWEFNQLGVDCVGFVRRSYIRLGIIDPNMLIPMESGKNSRTINGLSFGPSGQYGRSMGNLLGILSAKGMYHIADKLKVGEQLPGDFCLHGADGGESATHITLVVSYPDSEKGNESIVWGSGGAGKRCDASVAYAGVGCDASKGNIAALNPALLFKPVYGNYYQKHNYYRLKREFTTAKDANSWPFTGDKMPKTHVRQYKYPSKINEHPADVINARDLFGDARTELIKQGRAQEGQPPDV